MRSTVVIRRLALPLWLSVVQAASAQDGGKPATPSRPASDPPPPPPPQAAPAFTLTFHGILSGTFYVQDAEFGLGNGQKAEFVVDTLGRWVHGADVRNARLGVGIGAGEVMKGWRASGNVEIDFFGGFAAGGAFTSEQPQPRLRTAYVDLTGERTTLRLGQDWALTLGNIPVSVSHIAFPLGYGPGGFIGWRFPQIRLIQKLSAPGATTTAGFQFAVLRGSWVDRPATIDDFSSGERSLLPQVEGRFDFGGKHRTGSWGLYAVGHVDRKRFKATPEDSTLTSWLGELGASLTAGRLTLLGNGYYGLGMGHHFASIIQFGRIKSWGAWGQAGVNLGSYLSFWGYFGMDDPKDEDVLAAIPAGTRRVKSWISAPMLRFKAGPYALGLEWLHNRTNIVGPAGAPRRLDGNQVGLSVRYDF